MLNLKSDTISNECIADAEVVGSFCGQPILTIDTGRAEKEHTVFLAGILITGKSEPPEVLPGEERCTDGIIRRSTTAEVIGYDVYHNQEQIEAGQKRVSMAEARQASKDGAMVFYRPNRFVGEGEYALVEVGQ